MTDEQYTVIVIIKIIPHFQKTPKEFPFIKCMQYGATLHIVASVRTFLLFVEIYVVNRSSLHETSPRCPDVILRGFCYLGCLK